MFRDDQHAKLDAILAKYAVKPKLDQAVDLAERLVATFDLGVCRADDANFQEADHPRDAMGKFTSGGGGGAASHGVASYEKTLKKGAKGSTAGLIKHMLLTGDYSKQDIFKAAQAVYQLGSDKAGYVEWYKKDLLKQGTKVPEIPAVSKVGQETKAAEGPKSATEHYQALGKKILEEAKALPTQPSQVVWSEASKVMNSAQPAAEKMAWIENALKTGNPSDKTKAAMESWLAAQKAYAATAAAAPSATKASPVAGKSIKEKAEHYLPAADYKSLEFVLENPDKLTAENKPKVETKLKELFNALAENHGDPAGLKEALGKISPIDGMGMSVNSVNDVLSKVKAAHSASATPVYAPSTPAQVKAFAKLKAVPHFRTDHVNYFEDADGKELKAVLKTDTKKIPGDHYALVTSSYAGKKGDGNTSAVSTAMDSFKNATWDSYSPEEQLASQNYKGSTYDPMNDYLLGKTNDTNTPEYIKKYVKDFRTAVNKSVVPADTPVFRGLRCSLKSLSGFDDPEQSVGRCFEHKNFASVSRDRSVSEGFAGKGSSGAKVLMKMTIPAGATGMVLGQQHGEAEVVLPDRCTFRIDQVEPWDNGKGHFIHVTYLGVRDD